jgi:Holliday junction resolvasome RuvABC DNA-binding subunit
LFWAACFLFLGPPLLLLFRCVLYCFSGRTYKVRPIFCQINQRRKVKIGEILKGMPKATGGHWEEKRESKIGSAADFIQEKQTKNDAIKSLGFNQTQVERFQKLAENKDIVEQIKQEAIKTP